ncbi:uncharacterized protein LOC128930661 [Callithrix jacchus]|uniref:tumor rejection antigen P815A-like n=1 Tax=Callithrix jacchus TaxID=9483 RepID=UPI0023DCF830|nr:tumor rejection antigen P815A-like [Callithrix jacchus]
MRREKKKEEEVFEGKEEDYEGDEEDNEGEHEDYEGEEEDYEEDEEDEFKEGDKEEAEDEVKEQKEEDNKEDAEVASGACSPEHRVQDIATQCKQEYFFRESIPMSVLCFSEEVAEYKYENSDEEDQETGGKKENEEDENEELGEGLRKDLDSAEDSPIKKSSLEARKK